MLLFFFPFYWAWALVFYSCGVVFVCLSGLLPAPSPIKPILFDWTVGGYIKWILLGLGEIWAVRWTDQKEEYRDGPVGKWESSSEMLWKKSPVKLLPLITGTLDGAIHPINPNPITFRSVRSQFLSKLRIHIHKKKWIESCIITISMHNVRLRSKAYIVWWAWSSIRLPRKPPSRCLGLLLQWISHRQWRSHKTFKNK